MHANIAEYRGTVEEDDSLTSLLARVYVQGGFTDESVAARAFAPSEVKRRGKMLLATAPTGSVVGMIICGAPDNPSRQVAESDEAEMQLLAVDPSARGQGLGRALCMAFENKAVAMGYRKAVLSTQVTMRSAHRIYEDLGYQRNHQRDWVRANRSFIVYEKSL